MHPLNLISLYSNCFGQVFSLWVYYGMCARLQTSSAGLNLNTYTCIRMWCLHTCSLNKLVLELSQLSKYHSYRSVPTNLHLSVPKQLKICLDREDFKTSLKASNNNLLIRKIIYGQQCIDMVPSNLHNIINPLVHRFIFSFIEKKIHGTALCWSTGTCIKC